MLAEMRPSELGEWLALETVSPWSPWRGDWRAAQTAAILAEAYRDRKKRGDPFAVRDFMLDYLLDRDSRDKDISARIRASLMGHSHGNNPKHTRR